MSIKKPKGHGGTNQQSSTGDRGRRIAVCLRLPWSTSFQLQFKFTSRKVLPFFLNVYICVVCMLSCVQMCVDTGIRCLLKCSPRSSLWCGLSQNLKLAELAGLVRWLSIGIPYIRPEALGLLGGAAIPAQPKYGRWGCKLWSWCAHGMHVIH